MIDSTTIGETEFDTAAGDMKQLGDDFGLT